MWSEVEEELRKSCKLRAASYKLQATSNGRIVISETHILPNNACGLLLDIDSPLLAACSYQLAASN
jgi:hypothetical protein